MDGEQTSLFGQWIGEFHGNPPPESVNYVIPGKAIFNIEHDRMNTAFACIDQGDQLHGSRKDFEIKIEGNQISGRGTLTRAFDWEKNEMISVDESIKRQKSQRSDLFYIADLKFHGSLDNQTLNVVFSGSSDGKAVNGPFSAKKLSQNKPTACNQVQTWEEFKIFVSNLIKNKRELIFRGQPTSKHRLNTSFHREGRYDLFRYDTTDCEHLFLQINAISRRQYDRKNPADFGALLSLAQHHGFPTPLLDWSKSPYVAAFFAFEKHSPSSEGDNNPRIFAFDAEAWKQNTTQARYLADPRPVVTVSELVSGDNPRHLPQQSIHTYSNIEDIEAWIRLKEIENKKTYLTIIDIPSSERKWAMEDLRYMGVTAATLFPGLDGVCRSLKERFFSPRQNP